MTYLDYIIHFEKLDQAHAFSGNATRLYLKLLVLANAIGWPDEFTKSDAYMAAVCGFAVNTMKDCRAQLVVRGLLAGNWGAKGRSSAGLYRLLQPALKLSDFDSFSDEDTIKLSKSDNLIPEKSSDFDSLNSGKLSKSDDLEPKEGLKLSEKPSNFDALYIDKENNTSSAAVAASEGGLSVSREESDSQPAGESTAGPADIPPRAGRSTRKRGAALPTGPAELLPDSCPLAYLLNPGGLAARVQQLAEPLTLAQAERLLTEYNLPALRAIFCEMANWPKLLTSSTSANLTARNWLSKRPKTDTAPFSTNPTVLPPVAAEEELDESARQFRAELAAREEEEQNAHFARWANRPATA